jgi:hypothetical protein
MKKIISILIATVIIASLFPNSVLAIYDDKVISQKFSDVPSGHWAFSYINDMAVLDIFDGYPDGSFHPEKTVTRAELAKMLVSMLTSSETDTEWESLKSEFRDYDISYSDVTSSDWFAPYIIFATNIKAYMDDYEDGCFKPNQAATREEVAAALSKFCKYDTLDLSGGSIITLTYDNVLTEDESAIIETVLLTRMTSFDITKVYVSQNSLHNELKITIDDIEHISDILPLLSAKGEFKITNADGSVMLDGNDVKTAQHRYSKTSKNGNAVHYVEVSLTYDGKNKFYEATKYASERKDSGNNYLNFILDNTVIVSPRVMEAIDSNSVIISDFSEQEAKRISTLLKSGSFPTAPDTVDYQIIQAQPHLLSDMFSDAWSISEEFQKEVYCATKNGLISGYTDGTFRGQDAITRAETAAMIWKVYSHLNTQ